MTEPPELKFPIGSYVLARLGQGDGQPAIVTAYDPSDGTYLLLFVEEPSRADLEGELWDTEWHLDEDMEDDPNRTLTPPGVTDPEHVFVVQIALESPLVYANLERLLADFDHAWVRSRAMEAVASPGDPMPFGKKDASIYFMSVIGGER